MNLSGRSDTGRVRSANQDSYRISRLCRNAVLCVVCDGMGGAKSGNVASSYAADVFIERVTKVVRTYIGSDGEMELDSDDACRLLCDAVNQANSVVFRKSRSSAEYRGMGTTLVAALSVGRIAYVINVGDSRLYLISDEAITQITHDHSYVQHLVDSGSITAEAARTHPFRNRITRAVGIGSQVESDVFEIDLSGLAVCYLLLCSDGLSGQLLPEAIRSIVNTSSGNGQSVDTELETKAGALIDAANAAGGPDNITAVLVKYTQTEVFAMCDTIEFPAVNRTDKDRSNETTSTDTTGEEPFSENTVRCQ